MKFGDGGGSDARVITISYYSGGAAQVFHFCEKL
jgi:hypothetical protein